MLEGLEEEEIISRYLVKKKLTMMKQTEGSHSLSSVTLHDLKGAYISSFEQDCMEMMNTGRKGNRMKAKEKSRQLKKMTESNENMYGNSIDKWE